MIVRDYRLELKNIFFSIQMFVFLILIFTIYFGYVILLYVNMEVLKC